MAMENLHVKTNNVPREIIHGFELTETERAEFDYIDDMDSASFVRYKGALYDLGDLMRVPPGSELEKRGWHGYADGSAWHCTVFRYADDDCETVICGTADW